MSRLKKELNKQTRYLKMLLNNLKVKELIIKQMILNEAKELKNVLTLKKLATREQFENLTVEQAAEKILSEK